MDGAHGAADRGGARAGNSTARPSPHRGSPQARHRACMLSSAATVASCSRSVPESEIAIVRARHGQLPDVARLAGIIWRAHYPGIVTHEQIDYMLERGYALDMLEGFLRRPEPRARARHRRRRLAGFAAWYVDRRPGAKPSSTSSTCCSPGNATASAAGSSTASSAATLARRRTHAGAQREQAATSQAMRAYEKHGFAIREAVVVDIGGGFVMDDYVMAKPL